MARPLARRLEHVGVVRLADLVTLCNRRGRGWWRQVPRVGALAAQHIVSFLNQHSETLGTLDAHVTGVVPPSQRMSATALPDRDVVVPLEAIRLPQLLDGRSGRNRAPQSLCLISAEDDYQAIRAWLGRWPLRSETFRAYRKEAERFLAWSIVEQGEAFSDIRTSDCIAYCRFLMTPTPAARWCGPRVPREILIAGVSMSNPAWRPFAGPLSARSRAYSERVLRLLCAWLTDCHYLMTNPWDNVASRRVEVPIRQATTSSSRMTWQAMQVWLDYEARQHARGRLWRAALLLLSETGMGCDDASRAEVAKSSFTCGSVGCLEFDAARLIAHRDGRIQAIPISAKLQEALVAHWRDRKDQPGPVLGFLRSSPLPPRARDKALRGRCGYSPRGIRHIVRQAVETFSRSLWCDDPEIHRNLGRLNPDALPRAMLSSCLPAWTTVDDANIWVSTHRRRTPRGSGR
ncbi:phage integrase family protein [Cupriavidus neocaledonicus]